jgi:hypothetical protein
LEFGEWQQRLSPEQYEVVEVQTNTGLRRAMLLPKGILKAAWQADPLRKALLLERDPAPFQRKRLKCAVQYFCVSLLESR